MGSMRASEVPALLATLPSSPLIVLLAALAIVLTLVALVALTIVWRMLWTARELRRSNRRARRLSTLPGGVQPLTSFRRDGTPADPLNLRIVASARQLGAAFAAAGWYRADETTVVTALRISVGTVLRQHYATAPMSDLFLYGRRQDYAFEKPGRNVHERDHVRFWDTGERSRSGRPIWIGAATQDIAVKFSRKNYLLTHQIDPHIDIERDLIASDLIATGWVTQDARGPGFGEPTSRDNGNGDLYLTDGEVVVLTLADIPVLAPFPTTQVRGSLEAHLAQRVARAFRWRLPQAGRDRARRLAQRVAERARSSTPLRRRRG